VYDLRPNAKDSAIAGYRILAENPKAAYRRRLARNFSTRCACRTVIGASALFERLPGIGLVMSIAVRWHRTVIRPPSVWTHAAADRSAGRAAWQRLRNVGAARRMGTERYLKTLLT